MFWLDLGTTKTRNSTPYFAHNSVNFGRILKGTAHANQYGVEIAHFKNFSMQIQNKLYVH